MPLLSNSPDLGAHACTPQMAARIPVSIHHAEPIISTGLGTLLARWPQVRLVAAWAGPGAPDLIVVTDYDDAMARLPHAEANGEKVMIISQREREWDIRAAMAAGVHGYLPQRCDPDELQLALQKLGEGMRYFNQELLTRATQHLQGEHLTTRESDVLRLLATGCCNKRIALTLNIGVGTVKSHVKSLLFKLGATARTHAVVLATQRGMVS